jgi:hypothetical protein
MLVRGIGGFDASLNLYGLHKNRRKREDRNNLVVNKNEKTQRSYYAMRQKELKVKQIDFSAYPRGLTGK